MLDQLRAEAIADGFTDGLSSPVPSITDSEHSVHDHDHEHDHEEIQDDTVRFLKVSFPRQSVSSLEYYLKKCDFDVVRAVDELLNQETILEERDFQVDGETDWTEFYEPSRRRRRHKHRDNEEPEIVKNAGNGSRWSQIDAEVDWISHALSLEKTVVASCYHEHVSLPATLNALLQDKKGSSEVDEEEVKRLSGRYPLSRQRIIDILRATTDVSVAGEVCAVLAAWSPTIGTVTSSLKKTSISAPTKGGLLFAPPAAQHTTSVPTTTLSALECRELASEYARKRDEAFKQAAQAHQASRATKQSGSSSYYAQIGREMDAKMRKFKFLAAERGTVDARGTETDHDGVRVSVDLHGCTVHEALVILKRDLTSWYASPKTGPFTVITGVGNHSTGSAKLLPVVQKWLSRDGWRYQVHGGQIIVKGLDS